jgi:hypothetical protein
MSLFLAISMLCDAVRVLCGAVQILCGLSECYVLCYAIRVLCDAVPAPSRWRSTACQHLITLHNTTQNFITFHNTPIKYVVPYRPLFDGVPLPVGDLGRTTPYGVL